LKSPIDQRRTVREVPNRHNLFLRLPARQRRRNDAANATTHWRAPPSVMLQSVSFSPTVSEGEQGNVNATRLLGLRATGITARVYGFLLAWF
jgi:hypothetical protein